MSGSDAAPALSSTGAVPATPGVSATALSLPSAPPQAAAQPQGGLRYPSLEERANLQTLASVFDFCKTPGTDGDANTVRGALVAGLGAEDAQCSVEDLGSLPESEWTATVNSLKVNGLALKGLQRGMLHKVGTILRFLCTAPAPAPPPVQLAPPPAPAPVDNTRQVQLKYLTGQMDETTASVMTGPEYVAALKRWQVLYGQGQRPPANAEPSIEQLTAIRKLVTDGQPPYTDFALFTPHSNRHIKRRKLDGYRFGENGSLIPFEWYGPANFHE